MGLLFHQHPQQQTHPKLMTNMLKKVFNWSEVHLSKVTSFKIYTLHETLKFLPSTYTRLQFPTKVIFILKLPLQENILHTYLFTMGLK
jgi:hypothetical protein